MHLQIKKPFVVTCFIYSKIQHTFTFSWHQYKLLFLSIDYLYIARVFKAIFAKLSNITEVMISAYTKIFYQSPSYKRWSMPLICTTSVTNTAKPNTAKLVIFIHRFAFLMQLNEHTLCFVKFNIN